MGLHNILYLSCLRAGHDTPIVVLLDADYNIPIAVLSDADYNTPTAILLNIDLALDKPFLLAVAYNRRRPLPSPLIALLMR